MTFHQLKTCRVSFYLGNGVSIDVIVTGPFGNDADAKREAVSRAFSELNRVIGNKNPLMYVNSKPSIVEQMLGGGK